MYPRPIESDDPWGPDNLRKIASVWYEGNVLADNNWPVGLEGDTVDVLFRQAQVQPAGFALRSEIPFQEAPLMNLDGIPTPPTPP